MTAKKSEEPVMVKGETCPICHKKTLTLSEKEMDIPYFGHTFIFSMNCSSCGYHKADVEAEENKQPVKYTLEVEDEKDLDARIVKSSNALVKIPRIGSIEPGETSNGYVTNAEGIIRRMKTIIECAREETDDNAEKKKIKNMLKKLNKVLMGRDKLKIIIEDPSGNSAIISDKAVKGKL